MQADSRTEGESLLAAGPTQNDSHRPDPSWRAPAAVDSYHDAYRSRIRLLRLVFAAALGLWHAMFSSRCKLAAQGTGRAVQAPRGLQYLLVAELDQQEALESSLELMGRNPLQGP